jgi:hypothetical protein
LTFLFLLYYHLITLSLVLVVNWNLTVHLYYYSHVSNYYKLMQILSFDKLNCIILRLNDQLKHRHRLLSWLYHHFCNTYGLLCKYFIMRACFIYFELLLCIVMKFIFILCIVKHVMMCFKVSCHQYRWYDSWNIIVERLSLSYGGKVCLGCCYTMEL